MGGLNDDKTLAQQGTRGVRRERGVGVAGARAFAAVIWGAMLSYASTVQAGASSFMFVGAGAASSQHSESKQTAASLLAIEAGLGTSAQHPLVVAALLKSATFFEQGTDWELAGRLASSGFARGRWGWAFDVGGTLRYWGPDSQGVRASLLGGGPLGTTIGVSAGFGSNDTRTYTVTLGIDWARLTAHRTSLQNWWPNLCLPLIKNEVRPSNAFGSLRR